MKNKVLYALWGGLFILCAALGFIPNPQGMARNFLTVLAVVFFVPPGILLYRAARGKDRDTLKLIRNLSAASLAVTLVVLVLNFLSVATTEAVGDFFYGLLVILSSPMVCSGIWVLSMFLWACLLMASLSALKKKN